MDMNCKACGTQVSRDALACPLCGKPTKKAGEKKSQRVKLAIALGLMGPLLVGIAVSVYKECGREEPAASAAPAPEKPAYQLTYRTVALEFGKPDVLVEDMLNMTRVMVRATNPTNAPATCTVSASLLRGNKVLGTVTGNALGIPPGGSQLVELRAPVLIRGTKTVSFDPANCF